MRSQLAGFANFDPKKDIGSLEGKVVFVTGGTAGLGKASIEALAKHKPAHIYFTGRNTSAANTLTSQLEARYPGLQLTFVQMNLASLISVNSVANKFPHDRVDTLMCNGGIMDVPPSVSTDGFEIHMATNHLGHAMLIRTVLPIMERTADSGADVRIVIMSSAGYLLHPKEGIWWDKVKTSQATITESWARYAQSKLANLVYASQLARRYPKLLTVSIHPGLVDTGMIRNSSLLGRAYMYLGHWVRGIGVLPLEKGCLNQVWAAAGAGKNELVNGAYYTPVGVVGDKDPLARDERFGANLWTWTNEALDEV